MNSENLPHRGIGVYDRPPSRLLPLSQWQVLAFALLLVLLAGGFALYWI